MKNNSSDFVTIVMRTYNRPLMLKRALNSVMRQNYPYWKLALINNGGDAKEVMDIVNQSGIDQQKIHIIHNDAPLKLGHELNQGFTAIPAQYAAVHDDDDTWHPDYLAKAVDHLKNHKQSKYTAGVVCFTRIVKEKVEDNKIVELDSSGEYNKSISLMFLATEEDSFGEESLRTLGVVRLMDMLRWCSFTPTSFVYEQRVFEEIGRYSEEIKISEDYEFILRFLSHYSIDVIPEYLANYHHRLFHRCGDYTNITIEKASEVSNLVNSLASEWLIKDLAQGRVGLGVLMSLAQQNEMIIQQNEKILARLKKLEEK